MCVFLALNDNSKVNSPISPEVEHIWYFMPVQVICNFQKVSIKTKQAMLRTMSNMFFSALKGK